MARKRRPKGSNPQNQQNQSSQNPQNAGSATKRKRSRKRKRQDPRKFWGDAQVVPEPSYGLAPTEASDALVASLGKPPIPGHETSAKHYFELVYDRSVALSFALAAAGGLDKEAPAPLPTVDDPYDYDDFDEDE